MTRAADLIAGRELLGNLTLRELRGKYKRTALGWAWSMLNPLSGIVIYAVVFGVLLDVGHPKGNPSLIDNFTLWLSCALLPWNFTNNGVQATLPTLVGSSNLIKKVYFPREYIVASSVLSWLVTFLIELGVLSVAFGLFAHRLVLAQLPMVLVLVALQALFILGVALMLAALNVYFRDIQHFTGIFMQVWFYLTPIVYSLADKKDKIGKYHLLGAYKLNPMVHFVEAYRNCFYDGRMPGGESLAYIVVSVVASLVIGFTVFGRLEPRFAEEL